MSAKLTFLVQKLRVKRGLEGMYDFEILFKKRIRGRLVKFASRKSLNLLSLYLKILLMKNVLFLMGIVAFTFMGCAKKGMVGEPVISSHTTYEQTSTELYTITSAEIKKGFMVINVTAPGCDGKDWDAHLIDSEAFDDTNPPTRYLRLSLNTNGDCTTQVSKTLYFDLSDLQIIAFRGILLKLDGYNQTLNYSY